MMRSLFTFLIALVISASCTDRNINKFDETADARVADAIAGLKADLTAPPHGFKFNYQPENGAGAFLVLADFNNDNTVIIKTDLGDENGRYYEDTITWRIDNSLGLELIFENYSFFSYLFEQDQATFGAEYEYLFVEKKGDNLVFKSKSDKTLSPTKITLQPADADDEALLGKALAVKISTLNEDLGRFSSALSLTYQSKDLIFYLSNNTLKRVLEFTVVAKKSNISSRADVNLTSGYVLKGDSLVLLNPVSGTYFNTPITLKSIKLGSLANSSLNVCADPIATHKINGTTSSGDAVTLETSLIDLSGTQFTEGDFYNSDLGSLYKDGNSIDQEVAANITGARYMQLYYNYDIGSPFYAMGFYISNADGTTTFALRKFTAQLTGNNIKFTFDPTVSVFGSATTDADVNNVNIYLEGLAEGDQTYVYKLSDKVFEFYNPCSGYSFIFFGS
jgi:hypothetical protein